MHTLTCANYFIYLRARCQSELRRLEAGAYLKSERGKNRLTTRKHLESEIRVWGVGGWVGGWVLGFGTSEMERNPEPLQEVLPVSILSLSVMENKRVA